MSCSHYQICGGCSTQHIPYEKQLYDKEQFVQALFPNVPILPILASPLQWSYRNKMEFSFTQSVKKEHFLGLMMRKGRGKALNLTECFLSPPWFIEVLNEVRSWWQSGALEAYYPPKNCGHLRTLTCRFGMRTKEKMVVLTTSDELPEASLKSFVDTVLVKTPCESIILRRQIAIKKCPTRFEERVLFGKDHIIEELALGQRVLRFKIRASSFFQPNSSSAEVVYNTTMKLGAFKRDERVLDLYCGTGTIGLFASFFVDSVIGIEQNKDAVEDAKDNILQNGISNMSVFAEDVEGADLPKSDTVIIDPPRIGLHPTALIKIIHLAPTKILYISCNPLTQARDVQEFCKVGYRITAVQPVDQFPHTHHVENIVVLER